MKQNKNNNNNNVNVRNNGNNNVNSGKNKVNNGKNKKKMTKKVKKIRVKFGKNPTFAAKLGAFLLQGLKDPVIFSETGGFSSKQPQVSGSLPYFHMNITEKQFRDMLKNAKKVNSESLSKVCNKCNLNKVLSSVGFNCDSQSNNAIASLQQGLVDSINNRWSIRKNGQKRLKEVLEKMTWQYHNDIIPKSSIAWGK